MIPRDELERLKHDADATLAELMKLLNSAPQLVDEFKPLMIARDPVQEFTALVLQKPKVAEQILQMSLATLVNYHTSTKIAAELAGSDS